MAKPGLRLLPECLTDAVGDLPLVLGIDDAEQLGCRDRDLPPFARRVSEAHDLVGPAVQHVHRYYVA